MNKKVRSSVSLVKRRVKGVEVLGIELIRGDAQALAEALVMDDLPRTQEFDRVADVRVVGKAKDIVIGKARFLLRRKVFVEVGDRVAGHGEGRGAKRRAGRGNGIDAGGVIHKIIGKALGLDLLRRQVPGQLVDDGAHHLQMGKLLRADIRQDRPQLRVRHGVTLAQVAQGRADLAMRPAIMQKVIMIFS